MFEVVVSGWKHSFEEAIQKSSGTFAKFDREAIYFIGGDSIFGWSNKNHRHMSTYYYEI
jgi:hypothetical protein